MRLNAPQIEWIVQNYNQGRTIEELTLDTGRSEATIKRALSEAGVMDLSWHKSAEQHRMLQYLRTKSVVNLTQLQGKI